MKKMSILSVMVATAVAVFSFIGCRTKDGDGTLVNSPDAEFVYDRVVMIGIDGMGHNESIERTPNIHRLFEGGATTHDMLACLPTISAQNWGAILGGVGPDVSGFTNEGAAVDRNDSGEFPTVFKQIRKAMPTAQLASFCNWSPINYGIVENDIGVYKYNDVYGDLCVADSVIYEKALDLLGGENDPRFLFVHFGNVDIAGHTHGFELDEYYKALIEVDGYVGSIYDKIVSKGWADGTLFLVSVDHGGVGTWHGGATDNEKYVFFGAKGITVNSVELADMRVYDIPSVITAALGIDDAQNWTGSCPDGLFKS